MSKNEQPPAYQGGPSPPPQAYQQQGQNQGYYDQSGYNNQGPQHQGGFQPGYGGYPDANQGYQQGYQQGPPMGYQQGPPMGYQQGPGYGPGPGYPPPQGHYGDNRGNNSGPGGMGCLSGILAACACCCCLDMIF